ncbi:MAG: hypothetical protein BWZ02_03054 [Lentisphaerae bacterium ADurb.BinA184]|nr:MAG: hypothetical protein BWZ02_03054 [Lentisphaerae bacterium ADurb.BinA184]
MAAADGVAQPLQQQVNVVAAMAEQLSPADPLRLPQPRPPRGVRVLLGPDRDVEDVAVGPCAEGVAEVCPQGVVAHDVADHEDGIRRAVRGNELSALGLGQGERLLHEDVFVGVQAVHPDGEVEVVGDGDDHCVNRVEQLPAVGDRHGSVCGRGGLLRPRQVEVGEGGEPHPVPQRRQCADMAGGHGAAADHSYADHAARPCPAAEVGPVPARPGNCVLGEASPASRPGAADRIRYSGAGGLQASESLLQPGRLRPPQRALANRLEIVQTFPPGAGGLRRYVFRFRQ